MSDNVVVRFQFKGKDIDCMVNDVDKCNLIDLIHDFWDTAEKENTQVPNHPEFTYLYKMKHLKLATDQDLMLLFQNLAGRELIYIWVEEAVKPSTVVLAALSLRDKGVETEQIAMPATMPQPHLPPPHPTQAATPRRSRRLQEVVILDPPPPTSPHSPPPTPTHSITNEPLILNTQLTQTQPELDPNPPLSPGLMNEMVLDNLECWNNISLSPIEPNRGRGRGNGRLRGRGRGRGTGRGRSTAHATASQTEIAQGRDVEVGQSSGAVLNSPFLRKRVPKTSAVRRGTWAASGRGGSGGSRSGRVATELVHSLEDDDDVGLDSSEDTTFVPSNFDSVEDETVSLEAEERLLGDTEMQDIGEMEPVIHDDYDPDEGPIWEDDCEDIDNYIQRIYNNGEFYVDQEFGHIELKPWLLFTDKIHLRDVIRDFCIQSGFSVVVETASNKKYTIRCSDSRCGWRLHASKLIDGITWAIKSIQNSEHTCMGLETKNPMVSAKWAARALIEDIRANNDISGKALNELLWNRYGVEMSKSTLYRMKSDALDQIHGSHDISYSFLPGYCAMVKTTNPGSLAEIIWYPENHPERPLTFSSLFISFRGCVEGLFRGCRGVIGVDGTFLKGDFGGVLLSAVALDGNNEMFPVAWGIVSGEDESTWKFFIHHLKNLLYPGRGNKWCIISDRHKAIEKACTDLWPEVGRRYCMKHLSVNWKKIFPGPKMWQLFWLACGAFSDFTFKKAMKQIQKHKDGARVWLANLGEQERWAKHLFDPTLKCDVNKTNFVESFNATLGIDRQRPVLTLLEGIRRVTMVRMVTRRENCESWERQDHCPNVVKKVHQLCVDSRQCRAYPSSKGEFEIKEGYSTLVVSLTNHTCKCNAWQLTGIPCKHGMRAILYAGMDPLKYVHDWYSVENYKLAYSHGISPIPDREQWPEDETLPTINPPVMKRGVGRPVKNRRRGQEEQRKGKRSTTFRCSRCGEFGHNKLTCQGGPTRKQKEAASKAKEKKRTATDQVNKGASKKTRVAAK